MTPTVNIALDKSYKIKKGPDAGKYHAKIWVTFIKWVDGKKDWDQQPYKTGLFVTQKEFDSLMENDPKKKTRIERLKEIRSKLDREKARAVGIIEKYQTIDQRKFDMHFLSDHKPESLAFHYQLKIAELRSAKPEPKISSAEKYETSLSSLQSFFGAGVTFHDCTAERLQEYEDWYIKQDVFKPVVKWRRKKYDKSRKKSLTSVGINLRPLRHIFRRAIRSGDIPASLYPFGAGEGYYTIPEGGDDTKQFLELDETQAFLNWQHPDDGVMENYDYAVFSFLAFGVNLADIAKLRKSMLKSDRIAIDRQKIKGRKKKQKQLVIPLHPRMREIIQKRGNKIIGVADHYVFPILNDSMTPEEKFLRIRKLVRDVNNVLKMIDSEIGFSAKATSYTLRHSFSNKVMDQGATTEELQDMLGHLLQKTTEAYKHGFSLKRKKKFSDGLGR